MNKEPELISEEDLENVGGGRSVRSISASLKGTNNICPKCGKKILKFSAFDVEGSPDAQGVYMCADCNLRWLRMTAAADARNYTMVADEFNEDGKLGLLGRYKG